MSKQPSNNGSYNIVAIRGPQTDCRNMIGAIQPWSEHVRNLESLASFSTWLKLSVKHELETMHSCWFWWFWIFNNTLTSTLPHLDIPFAVLLIVAFDRLCCLVDSEGVQFLKPTFNLCRNMRILHHLLYAIESSRLQGQIWIGWYWNSTESWERESMICSRLWKQDHLL